VDVVNEEYVEVITTPAAIPRYLDAVYVEAVTIPIATPRTVMQYYIEVITSVPVASTEGWGIPIN
jgi:hypothetical protein